MKYILTILISLSVLSIQAQDTIKIPTPVAKQIVKDLILGDSAKTELVLTKTQLSLTEQKVILKDTIISRHNQKGIMYEDRIKNEQAKFDTQNLFIKDLQKQNKKLKVKLTFTQIASSAVLGGLLYLYISK